MASTTKTSTTPNPSHYNERGVRERWPVLVYRLQSHRGWEVYIDPDMEAPSSKKKTRIEELTAAPREGCIEVRKMRLRIRLFEQHTPWERSGGQSLRRAESQCDAATVDGATAAMGGMENDTHDASSNSNQINHDSDIPGIDGWNNNALLVRRLNTLLVSTRRGMGAIVFKFKTNQDCIDFCDRLVFLNKKYFCGSMSNDIGSTSLKRGEGADDLGYVNGMDQREYYCNELREAKRRRSSMMGDEQATSLRATSKGREENDVASEEVDAFTTMKKTRQSRRNDEIHSYIVRLVHDEDFRGFVDEIERGLLSAPDTAGILLALGV
ncbi:hypothetical protein HJC23_001096 [Cyclotella cryptica]|uniref:Uncharacterized protein n=1 Tax=Cyclotella cryptica TaxID=29204 RepID=A0ABD3QQM2_9STRA|eukprot:CCRYP_005076-RA/>CCRYP_005076-RA protein AED:0.01 eAED:0.00 QI:0/-1/0/1/-1/1/1/0/323